jgi:N-acetylglucosamine-6-phosphate deacetylase
MQTIIVKNLYTNGLIKHNQCISIDNGIIVEIAENNNNINFDFENLAPALFDLHINGGEQFHFTHKADLETLHDIVDSANKNGVQFVLPTLITSSLENIFKGIDAIKAFMTQFPDSGILGMHLEGPFLNPKKRGAHLEKYILKPELSVLKEIINYGGEYLKLLTIAPEMFTDEQLKYLIACDVTISAGHSNSTFEESQHAFGLGINLVTHLYNAMSPFSHRAPGLIGASLSNKDVYTPIILDGVHCTYDAAAFALKNKGDKLFLISDALFQNNKKQSFHWEEFDAFLKDNQYINSDGNLAGATISLADAVINAVHVLKIPIAQALNMASSLPINRIKSNRKIGSLSIGSEAKFITFDNNFSKIESKIY